MILDDPRSRLASSRVGSRATLDELLRRAALRRPDDIALLDPPNREAFTDGAPRRLTFAQADRMVSAIAGRLRRMGLYADAIVGIQIANTAESVLTMLGVLRAGLIAMPLPLLWRRAEAVAALGRVGAHALIVSGRIGSTDHFDLAMQVAAEIFPVRYVCGYGRNAPDGLIPFDDLFTAEKLDPIPSLEEERGGDPSPGAHLAVITWDTSADGPVPVGRNHTELIAGGLAVVLESGLEQDAVLLSTLTMSSFAGARHRDGAMAPARRNAGAAPAVRSGRLPRSDQDDRTGYGRRSGTARRPTRGQPAIWARRPDPCHRRLARTRAAGARAAVAHDAGSHDRRAGIRGSRSRCRLPRAGRQAGRHALGRRVRPAQPQGHAGGCRDRDDGAWHCGVARADGAAGTVPAGSGSQRPALFQGGRQTDSSIPAMPAASTAMRWW